MPFEPAKRVAGFGQSIFTQITELAARHGAIDLSTGFPDADGPQSVKDAAAAAMQAGRNQYALSHGEPELRQAVAAHIQRFYGQAYDPETEITVTNGAAEALHAICDGLVDPGDEVVVFEPFYEVYAPNILMAGGVPRYVPLRPPGWGFDSDELAAAFSPRTRMLLLNTPHNPTGRVFTADELDCIASLCQQWNAIAVTDEVYEHLVFDGAQHRRLAQHPGMAERTLTVSSLSKTFGFTGWRIGWVAGPPDLTRALRLAHQFVLDCSATPLQYGAVEALHLGDDHYTGQVAELQVKRDFLAGALAAAGFEVSLPASGFFIMAGIEPLGFDDDVACCLWLAGQVGVAAIPPSAFFAEAHKALGKRHVRFAFCKTTGLLEAAAERLGAIQRSRP
jgi:N-succinyldiaminopimelate aminotransferase